VEETVPEWDSIKGELGKYHLGVFYRSVAGLPTVEQLRRFLSLYGRDRLFEDFPLTYESLGFYVSMADYLLNKLRSQPDGASYNQSVREFLDWEFADYLLAGLISKDSHMFWGGNALKTALDHLTLDRGDARTYLVDWLVLGRSIGRWGAASSAERREIVRKLRGVTSRRGKVRAFYAALLLGSKPPDVSADDLGLKPETFQELQRASKKRMELQRPRKPSPK